ncbi:hypothetical protein LLH23_20015 [bacterium]|nr:hypothetical protein [bacterium]
MAERSLTEYPNPQQWYSVNMAAVTWRELYRAAGNPVTFILSAWFVGFFKLCNIHLSAGQMPREISFQSPREPVPEPAAGRIERLLDELAALGFRHFTTFLVPELQFAPIMYACVHEENQAFADVTYHSAGAAGAIKAVSGQGLTYAEFTSLFNDGADLTSVGRRSHPSIDSQPSKTIVYHRPTTVAALWEQHLLKMQEMTPQHGGLSPEMTEDDFFTHLRDDIRSSAQFQLARGVLKPLQAATPTPPRPPVPPPPPPLPLAPPPPPGQPLP